MIIIYVGLAIVIMLQIVMLALIVSLVSNLEISRLLHKRNPVLFEEPPDG